MWRLLSIVLFSSLPVAEVSAADPAEKPNVLFIVVDDLNDWTGCLGGHPQAKTPNIDRLARRGTLFTRAYCPAPACLPSRAATLTGVAPYRSGCYVNSPTQTWYEILLPTADPLPAHFRACGYETAGAGKVYHHYQNHPASWDDFWPSKNLQFPPTHVPAKEFQPAFDKMPRTKNRYMEFNWGPLDKEVDETGDWMSMKFVSQKLQEKHDKPFFLACGIYRPHVPWFVPREFFDMFPLDEIQLPPKRTDDYRDIPKGAPRSGPCVYYRVLDANGYHRQAVQAYLASIAYADKLVGLLCGTASVLFVVGSASAQYAEWEHSGSIYILTTPEGADLPASASVKDFPLLIRLHRDHFPFPEAEEGGSDIRFSAGGQPLSYEIEQWDREGGTASIWVRIPSLRGNDRQEIKVHWGKPGSPNSSDGRAVFNVSNGYIGVWHLGGNVRDVVGNLDSQNEGTTETEGRIGNARRFPGKMGVFCGKDIQTLPSGGAPHSTQAWFRPDTSNGRIVCWGNEKRAGKVTMNYRSPPRIRMDCYFSNGDVRAEVPGRTKGWTHAVHTFEDGQSLLYINGEKRGEGNPAHTPMAIERPARMWIGGWYNNYDFVGDIDEVRISGVARSADWVRLEYENQKPMQTLVGPVVQPGDEFSLSPGRVEMNEGETVALAARAGGAQKTYWSVVHGDEESVVATDRFNIAFDAGRVTGDRAFKVRFDAVYADGVRSIEIPVAVKESLPEPQFALIAPANWDGRETIEIRPEIRNLEAMQNAGVGELDYRWEVSGLATIKDEEPGKLVLSRAQNSGKMTVRLSLANGGDAVVASADVAVREPNTDAWVPWVPGDKEMPVEGQFYARDDGGQGTLHCKGILEEKAEEVFLRVFADGKRYAEETKTPGTDGSYSFAVKLRPALVQYRIEFGTRTGDAETVLHRAGDILCGDAYLIDGQSNALATDTREQSPRITNQWIRSYGRPRFFQEGKRENLWCQPVWKAQPEHLAELGWWGMELAERLVESQRIPVFIVNAARGGTRIDQHQRNDENPTDLETIYGRMLWRVKEAHLTHGIRAVIWHQGENDQGAAGPDGGYGWETYQGYFVEMSADWKRDFPNVRHYYVFQIWPNSCSMGSGHGDMLREKQRTLPRLYSNMDILSTLGIKPPGPCHYPLQGWSQFAIRLQPLIERDFFGRKIAAPITPANLEQAYYTSDAQDAIALEFDQPVVWKDSLVDEFRLDGEKGKVASGAASGNVLALKLKEPVRANRITYLDETAWSQDRLLIGKNGIAALTFCNVPIHRHVLGHSDGF